MGLEQDYREAGERLVKLVQRQAGFRPNDIGSPTPGGYEQEVLDRAIDNATKELEKIRAKMKAAGMEPDIGCAADGPTTVDQVGTASSGDAVSGPVIGQPGTSGQGPDVMLPPGPVIHPPHGGQPWPGQQPKTLRTVLAAGATAAVVSVTGMFVGGKVLGGDTKPAEAVPVQVKVVEKKVETPKTVTRTTDRRTVEPQTRVVVVDGTRGGETSRYTYEYESKTEHDDGETSHKVEHESTGECHNCGDPGNYGQGEHNDGTEGGSVDEEPYVEEVGEEEDSEGETHGECC